MDEVISCLAPLKTGDSGIVYGFLWSGKVLELHRNYKKYPEILKQFYQVAELTH